MDMFYGIVKKGERGLHTEYGRNFTFPDEDDGVDVVAIYRGPLNEVERRAREFMRANAGKPVRALSEPEILALLRETSVGTA
jgi:hypothetical protein